MKYCSSTFLSTDSIIQKEVWLLPISVIIFIYFSPSFWFGDWTAQTGSLVSEELYQFFSFFPSSRFFDVQEPRIGLLLSYNLIRKSSSTYSDQCTYCSQSWFYVLYWSMSEDSTTYFIFFIYNFLHITRR